MAGWRRGNSVEKRLRRERPEPSDDLVRRISAQLDGERRQRHWNFGFAFALTVALVCAFALTGGVRYAASAVSHGTQAVAHLVSANSSAKLSSKKHDKGDKKKRHGDDDNGEGSGDDQYKHNVLMCHPKPEDDGDNDPFNDGTTIHVKQSDVPAHQAAGDQLGPCPRDDQQGDGGGDQNVTMCQPKQGDRDHDALADGKTIQVKQSQVAAHQSAGDVLGKCPPDRDEKHQNVD